ncbi:hypothetical protein N7456_002880 [Penicillium angulare]|uniref:Short-chain dehydrogenase/reductase SDR n=1 Tax=Penicillium angulare TaxID=116970 RepID=A0A9W9FU94_9EURO|nr:hypothetical protein N7456_002880 [Penicillium angulare]
MQLPNRTFIITGGSSGLGLATAKALVGAGAHVGLLDLTKLPENVDLPSPQFKDYQVDISSTDQVCDAIRGVLEWTKHTNAPIGGIMNSRFQSLSLQKINQAININLVGTLDIIRQAVPHIARLPEEVDPEKEGERGVIIMISSAAAFDGQQGQVAYSATKGAIQALTLPLARDLSPYGIRAVSIAPNMFSTPMTAQGKMPEKARLAIESHYEWPKRAGRPAESLKVLIMTYEITSKYPLTILRCNVPSSHYAFGVWRQAKKASLQLAVNARDDSIIDLMLRELKQLQIRVDACHASDDGKAILREVQDFDRQNQKEFAQLMEDRKKKRRLNPDQVEATDAPNA